MLSRRWVRFFALITLICLGTYITPYAAANDLEEQIQQRFDELDSLKEFKDEQEMELKEFKNEEERLQEELKELEISVQQHQQEINRLQQEINATEEEIELVTAELHEAEAEYEKINTLLKRRLRALYENGEVEYLEVLLDAASFSEFITRLNNLKTIAENDYQLLEQAEKERLNIQAIKDDLENKHDNLVYLRLERAQEKEELDRQVASRESILVKIQEQIDEQERVIAELEQEAAALDEMIVELQEEQRLQEEEAPGELLWPVEGFGRNWITSGFGFRTHPITGRQGVFHGGVDIGIPRSRWPGSFAYSGNPVNVRAAANGVVIYAGVSGSLSYGYGRLVIVDHGGGMSTVYAHNHHIHVSVGQEVTRGQTLAVVGSTGSSTGPHLHFEVRINGERVNPMPYL